MVERIPTFVARGARNPDARSRCLRMMVAVLCVWMTATPAHATFTEQIAVDTKAISLANTVTADPPGILSVHYNPAGLSRMPVGKYVSLGGSVAFLQKTSYFNQDPDFKGFLGGYKNDPLDGTQGSNTGGDMYVPILDQEVPFLFAPEMGMSYRAKGSKWTFALGNYAPYAVGFTHDNPNDPVRYGAQHVYRQHLVYLAPAVSYQMTDTFSLGLTVGMGQTAMGAGLDMRAPNDMVALTRVLGNATKGLEIPILSELTFPAPWFGGGVGPYDRLASLNMSMRDDFSPNFNVGMLWAPYSWLSLGAVYQSPIKAQLTGKYRFDYSPEFQRMVRWFGSSPTLMAISGMLNLPINPVSSQSGTVTSDYEYPQRVQMGVKVKPFRWLSLLADLHWANWSVLKEDRFTFDQDIELLQLVKILGYTGGNRALVMRRDFKDTWSWSVGTEIQATDWLALRFGYEHRPSSVRTEFFDSFYCLPDLDVYGAGLGIKLKNNVKIDLGFGYLVNSGITIRDNGSSLLNSTDSFKPVYNPYAGLDYRQDTRVYIGSLKVTMPLEVMSDWVDRTLALLNPFESSSPVSRKRLSDRTDRRRTDAPAAMTWMDPVPETASTKVPTPPSPRPRTPPAPSTETTYTLDLGTFHRDDRAKTAAGYYRTAGYPVTLTEIARNWHVHLGQFDSVPEAEGAMHRLNLPEARIRPLPVPPAPPASVKKVYTLVSPRFESRARADMASSCYAAAGFAPEIVARPHADGRLGWVVRIGRYASIAAARAFRKQHGLSETAIQSIAGVPVFFTLRLAFFASRQRAVLALDFYQRQGLSVRLHRTGKGVSLLVGRFAGEAQADRYRRTAGLSEAVAIPIDDRVDARGRQ